MTSDGHVGCLPPSAVGDSAWRSSASGPPGIRAAVALGRDRRAGRGARAARAAALRPLASGCAAPCPAAIPCGAARADSRRRHRTAARLGPRAAAARLRRARPAGGAAALRLRLRGAGVPGGSPASALRRRRSRRPGCEPAAARARHGHGWNGSRDDVSLDLGDRSAWLVLARAGREAGARPAPAPAARSATRRARARSTASRGLASPRECSTARFEFAAEARDAAYLLSARVGPVMLAPLGWMAVLRQAARRAGRATRRARAT